MPIIKSNRVIPLQEIENIVEEASRAELYAMGLSVIKQYLVPLSPQDTKIYVLGHKLRFTGRGFNVKMNFVNDVAYAQYIENGRTAGKRPPLHQILGWVRRHGIGEVYSISTRKLLQGRNRRTGKFVSGKDALEQGQLFAAKKIAAKIARFGQPGKYLYRDLSERNAKSIANATTQIEQRIQALLK